MGALFFYLEADYLLLGFFLPIGVAIEDLFLEGGDVVVKQVGDVG